MKIEAQIRQKIEKQEATLPQSDDENQIIEDMNTLPFSDILNQGLNDDTNISEDSKLLNAVFPCFSCL